MYKKQKMQIKNSYQFNLKQSRFQHDSWSVPLKSVKRNFEFGRENKNQNQNQTRRNQE